ncbi:uncharacterized protein Z519_11842 [Cladophialophora bantiana CBS 173.52]|uniref:Heme oxygenase n=1 Tax=Cladophialophora bantiana (strain ATCC 10958 / CBS 173.52 / CDC B-1940 / NIH 8579) TaxID=1442370 RepID=A0A0D2HSZ1_CLAB1|nr:uncharacterized protein Z519_11842 [Cladophialophora bantiana CBS 173.52]KIW87519.1 hypothetical protein Z519_11842 [Cladophialophora bantiana CBS 173.52]
MSSQFNQEGGSQTSLAEELRATTRQRHHALNAQITPRLPLCLPPIADSPLVYVKGMIVFGQIYFAFEQFLETQLACPQLNQRLLQIYEGIHFPWLLRSSQLRHDIDALKSDLLRSQIQELEVLLDESRGFRLRIERSLSARPHVLLAYTWTMYLALFNGGRWIRGQLVSAGPEFWRGSTLPLTFWEFRKEGEADVGDERLKEEFKEGFQGAASILTEEESRNVVEETMKLFDMCLQMVEFLDNKAATSSSQESFAESPSLAVACQLKDPVVANSTVASLWQYLTSVCSSIKTTTSTALRGKASSAG